MNFEVCECNWGRLPQSILTINQHSAWMEIHSQYTVMNSETCKIFQNNEFSEMTTMNSKRNIISRVHTWNTWKIAKFSLIEPLAAAVGFDLLFHSRAQPFTYIHGTAFECMWLLDMKIAFLMPVWGACIMVVFLVFLDFGFSLIFLSRTKPGPTVPTPDKQTRVKQVYVCLCVWWSFT